MPAPLEPLNSSPLSLEKPPKIKLRTVPTSLSPLLDQATTEGVVRCPSALGTITGFAFSIAATAELVVPKSIPTT